MIFKMTFLCLDIFTDLNVYVRGELLTKDYLIFLGFMFCEKF